MFALTLTKGLQQRVSFSTKIYDKRDDFDFELVYFPFYMVMFLAIHHMESIYLNSFVLLEDIAMLQTSTLAIKC